MAKLAELPNRQVIDLFRGLLDFAIYKGQPYARSFPKKPKQPRSSAVLTTQKQFAYSSKIVAKCSAYIHSKWRACVTGRGWHWKDVATVAYYGLEYYPNAPLFALLNLSTAMQEGYWYCYVETDIQNNMTLNYSTAKPFYVELKRLLRGVIQTYATLPQIIPQGSYPSLTAEPTTQHTFKIAKSDIPSPFYFTFTGTTNTQPSPSITPVFTLTPDFTLA
jgi:hypothetical protein